MFKESSRCEKDYVENIKKASNGFFNLNDYEQLIHLS